jgi:hypothetical protein
MNKKLSFLSVLSLLTAGVLTNVVPTNAASMGSIIGTLEISGSNILATGTGITDPRTTPPTPITTIDFGFFGDSVPIDPDVVPGLGEFFIDSGDGVFGEFNPPPPQVGRIKDLPTGGQFAPVNDFLAFASNFGNSPPVTAPGQFNTTFDLTELDPPVYTQTSRGINANFDVGGTFTLPDGRVLHGEGILGGEILFSSQPGTPFNDLDSFLAYISTPGNTVDVDSWSGNLNVVEEVAATVPEPTMMMGLLTISAFAMTFMRKQRS